MQNTFTRAAQVAALGLIVTVVTQAFYFGLSSSGIEPNRPLIWGLEVLTFVAIAIAGFTMLPSRALVGAAIGVSGVLNTIQAGMGLVMFGPLSEGGEAIGPVFSAVLAMAFLLYYAAKIAIGVGAIALGRNLLSGASGTGKTLGALAALTGLAAVVLNALAIGLGRDWMLYAGGAGTAAALFLGLALFVAKPASQD